MWYIVEIYNNLDELERTVTMTEAEVLELMRKFDNSFGCHVYEAVKGQRRKLFSINM